MKNERWKIGYEYDGFLISDVRRVLVSLGYKEDRRWRGLGGSQEISHWEYMNSEGRLVLEAETYIGLTIEGPPSLVTAAREAYLISHLDS